MTAYDEKKAATIPAPSIPHCSGVNAIPFLSNEYAEAASMVGIARKNENSAAAKRLAPNNMAPIMVAAERDVPGIMARH